jgi:hypothetical protein
MLAVTALTVLTSHIGLEAVSGAFLAGGLARLLDPDLEASPPSTPVRLGRHWFRVVVLVFFVTSGVRRDAAPPVSMRSVAMEGVLYLLAGWFDVALGPDRLALPFQSPVALPGCSLARTLTLSFWCSSLSSQPIIGLSSFRTVM